MEEDGYNVAETVAQKMKKVAEAAQKAASTSSEKPNLDSSTETLTENGSEVSPTVAEENRLTPEQVAANEQSLRDGIARGIEWFEFGQDEEQYKGMTEKEQTFTRLLDPMIWSMREALITYEHDDCDECRNRRETGGNAYALVIADMLLGRM